MSHTAVRLRPPEGDRFVKLIACAAQLGEDELAVLHLVAERLVKGREFYGNLSLASDPRDFRRESIEEVADALVYASCALLRRDGGAPT
jgi:hypothetical protein